ncbi:hypothetical protein Mapa_015634 [Marchantia paleacea]|nr:hypothetical protein Mapa_015634 [Marchantia paleacea]
MISRSGLRSSCTLLLRRVHWKNVRAIWRLQNNPVSSIESQIWCARDLLEKLRSETEWTLYRQQEALLTISCLDTALVKFLSS